VPSLILEQLTQTLLQTKNKMCQSIVTGNSVALLTDKIDKLIILAIDEKNQALVIQQI